MKPPICTLCGKRLTAKEGGLVYFQKVKEDIAWDRKAKDQGFVGHPPYCDWFCGRHFDQAKELQHLTRQQAFQIMAETK